MKEKEFLQELTTLINRYGLDSNINLPDFTIATYLFDSYISLSKIRNIGENKDEESEFIDRMYQIYPAKCPKRGTSTGKSHKDKQRIKKLLKSYTMEEIEKVFNHEIEEKYDKQYMQNFATFLNNFPDVNALEQGSLFVEEKQSESNSDSLIINGQIYR
jgi:hypothetical protein